MSFNILTEIPTESLPLLRDLYKVNWPEHVVAYSFINNMINRFEKHSKHRELIKIMNVNGTVEEDGTFVAVMQDQDILSATLDLSCTHLKAAQKLINFEKQKMFMMVRKIYVEATMNSIREIDLKILWDNETLMYYMNQEDALKIQYDIPDELEIRSLSIEDAEKVNSVWPHASHDSVKFITYCIQFNVNVGLYDKNSKELLAWCLVHDFGSLLALQVDENHLRKGYGSLVAKAITKKIAEESNCDITANIIADNFKSIGLFKKLAFNDIDKNSWIGVIQKTDNE